jgi:predicted Zn-dependent protease
LQFNPNLWPAANNLAFLISETSRSATDLSKAADLARKALKQQPDNPVVLDTVGWIHYRQGNLLQAFAYIEKAVEQDNTGPILHYHLATVLYQTGRSGEARIQLEQALATNTDFYGRDDAERLLGKLKGKS